ncbi:ABC transporter permease [Alicyclobacillus sp. ALC3]|uniref:ABC transporter permease n=1 Tax=Alicyclobacillus sp. ALC3 TaxID=2796143 RepID=UPI002379ADC6|nr:ABC transporter permease [Alicyclobacillus sp. ALC3]WDL95812.1 ABC transporter permease [Alicyclobacillus sp. ALC3]
MRIRALVVRIWRQLLHDKRTIALMLIAPIFILTLVWLVFNGSTYHPKIGVVNVPSTVSTVLKSEDATVTKYTSAADALAALKAQKLDAYINYQSGQPQVVLEGSDPSKSKAVLLDLQKLELKLSGEEVQQAGKAVQQLQTQVQAMAKAQAQHAGTGQPTGPSTQPGAQLGTATHAALPQLTLPQLKQPTIKYLYGSANMSSFDNFGPVLIGFFAFFFVFMVSGISFLKERTTGTLERLVATPIRRWEIVAGYVLGFGAFTTVQAALIAWYCVDVLGMMMAGQFISLLVVTLLLSLTALTLGVFLSTFANSEFQMMQFIPLIIVPQVFFSGLFNLDTMAVWLRWLSHIMPLYYGGDALRNIMIRGESLSSVWGDLVVLLGLSMVFMGLNVVTLRKYRKV